MDGARLNSCASCQALQVEDRSHANGSRLSDVSGFNHAQCAWDKMNFKENVHGPGYPCMLGLDGLADTL
jgi:hypothetical protein